MSKVFKSILLYLVFTVIPYAVACAAIPQIEEGWRWKKSLDVYITTRAAVGAAAVGEEVEAAYYGPIPVQQIHTEMASHEMMLTSYMNRDYQTSNIAIASITLVLQMGEAGEQRLYRTTDWLKGAGLPAAVMQQVQGRERDGAIGGRRVRQRVDPADAAAVYTYFFPSTGATTFSVMPDGWGTPARINRANDELYTHLTTFIDNLHGLDAAFARGRFGLPAEQPNAIDPNFSGSFQHSEEKFIQYLWDFTPIVLHDDEDPQPRPYDQSILHNKILEILTHRGVPQENINRLKLVVLHMHSCRDPCLRCRLALSLFALKAQAGLRGIEGIDENCRFIITISSRDPYEHSRSLTGHGFRYGHPISVGVDPLREGLEALNPPAPPAGGGVAPPIWWQQIPESPLPPAVGILEPVPIPLGGVPALRILGPGPALIIPAPAADMPPPAIAISTFNTILWSVPILSQWREDQRLPD